MAAVNVAALTSTPQNTLVWFGDCFPTVCLLLLMKPPWFTLSFGRRPASDATD
jgi:hypothetical protein